MRREYKHRLSQCRYSLRNTVTWTADICNFYDLVYFRVINYLNRDVIVTCSAQNLTHIHIEVMFWMYKNNGLRVTNFCTVSKERDIQIPNILLFWHLCRSDRNIWSWHISSPLDMPVFQAYVIQLLKSGVLHMLICMDEVVTEVGNSGCFNWI